MDEKQAIMVKMLELQHLFGKQTDRPNDCLKNKTGD